MRVGESSVETKIDLDRIRLKKKTRDRPSVSSPKNAHKTTKLRRLPGNPIKLFTILFGPILNKVVEALKMVLGRKDRGKT